MATTYSADLVAQLRLDLGDPPDGSTRWSDSDLQRAIARALAMFSRHHPCKQKTTIATVNASHDIDISILINRVSVDKLEFPIDESPRVFTPFTVYLDLLTMSGQQGDGNNCYVYWSGVHICTDASYTVEFMYRDLIELGAVAFALEAYASSTLAEKVGAALEAARTAIDKVSSKVTLAETALTNAASVATDIATQLTAAGTALTSAATALAAAIATGSGSIDAAIATKLTDVATRISSACTSLAAASTAITSSTARLTSSSSDLASGEDFIPTANIGLDPAGKWSEYAGRDIQAAEGYNHQAGEYMGQAAQYLSSAHAELAYIKTLDDKRNACIATGTHYIQQAHEYTLMASELNTKRLSYLSISRVHLSSADSFLTEGSRQRGNAEAYTAEAKALSAQAKPKMDQFLKEIARGSAQKQLKTLSLLSVE